MSEEILVTNIKTLRKVFGWNQADLAQACGLTLPVITNMESRNGHRHRLFDTLAVARAFGIGLEELATTPVARKRALYLASKHERSTP